MCFQGSKCEVQVKNGGIYEGVFKTYSPKVIFTFFFNSVKPQESATSVYVSVCPLVSDLAVYRYETVCVSHFHAQYITFNALLKTTLSDFTLWFQVLITLQTDLYNQNNFLLFVLIKIFWPLQALWTRRGILVVSSFPLYYCCA